MNCRCYFILVFVIQKLRLFSQQRFARLELFLQMQLQIQTLQKSLQPSTKQQSHASLSLIKNFFQPHRVQHPSLTLLSQLRQIQLIVKADYHYLTNLKKKTFQALEVENYQAQLTVIQKAFLCFKYSLLLSKRERQKKRSFIQQLNLNYKSKQSIKQKHNLASTFYQTKLLKTILRQTLSMIKIKKKSQALQKYILHQDSLQFINLLKEHVRTIVSYNLHQQSQNSEVDKIYEKKIYSKGFNAFKLFYKFNRLEKNIKSRALKKFIVKLIQAKRQALLKISNFKHAQAFKTKRIIFEAMRQSKLQSQCLDWYRYRLQKYYFKKWVEHSLLLKNQNQIQESNQIILNHYLEHKASYTNQKFKAKYFSFWKSYTSLEKQQKKQTRILKSFAELKQKEYLERKYFIILKENRNHEKSFRFYQKRLKFKTLQGLKMNIINGSRKLQNVLNFIQKRTIKKYFHGIRDFIKQDAQKVYLYCLEKAWAKFTLNITVQYFKSFQKAKNYHETLLKFKSIIGLKEAVKFNRKASYCAYFINMVLPIKRWNQRFKLRKWIEVKEHQQIKRVFFQWKLIAVRKLLSQQKQPITEELFIESRIALRNKIQKDKSSTEIFERENKKNSKIYEQQISFFKKMQSNQSDEDDGIEKKVDALLSKIKTQRKKIPKEIHESKGGQSSTNEKLLFTNQGLSQKFSKQTNEKIRIPTWSTPGNDYRVSVFSDDLEE